MPRIRPLDPADAEGSNREVFEAFIKERGNVPNMMRTMGLRPESLRSMVAHMRVVMRSGTVPPILKELIAVRVSCMNACEYCLASHVRLALQLGASEAQISALEDLTGAGEAAVTGFPEDCLGTAPETPPGGTGDPAGALFTPAERAALRFSEHMTQGTGHVPDGSYRELQRHFDPAQIVEIAAVAGLFNYFNRFNNALEIEITT